MQSVTLLLTTDVLPHVLTLVLHAVDQKPEDEDVKAGWTAFAIFLGLIAAVAFLGFSLTKQLRRAAANQQAGMFGDVPETPVDGDSDTRQA